MVNAVAQLTPLSRAKALTDLPMAYSAFIVACWAGVVFERRKCVLPWALACANPPYLQ
jgi:hypothetical protein